MSTYFKIRASHALERRCFFVIGHPLTCAPWLLAALLAGCGAAASKQTPEDGNSVTVHCNKSSLRWDACYEMAANVCGEKGYQIVSEGDSAMPETSVNSNEVLVIGGSLTIRCNQ